MSLENTPNHTPHIEEVLSKWKKTPIILASGSIHRKQQLEMLGFSDVTNSEYIPDEVEIRTASALNVQGGIPSFLNQTGSDIARHIAGAKVEYVLNQGNILPEAVVIGFDIAPVIWTTNMDTGKLSFEHLEKPVDHEASQLLIEKVIHTTAEGCVLREQKIKDFLSTIGTNHTIEDKTMMVKNYSATVRTGTITIISATAGSFPGNDRQIVAVADTIHLFSHTIDSHKLNKDALTQIARAVFTEMGNTALTISGGIDYTNEKIKDILQLEEIHFFEDDSDTDISSYQSFSERSLTQLLLLAELNR